MLIFLINLLRGTHVRIIIVFLSIFLLAGCSSETVNKQLIKELKVTIDSKPEHVKLNEAVEVKSIVEYGGKRSKGAEISFEIMENGTSIGNVTPDNLGEGVYGIETMFIEPGEHQIIAHVNYKEFHEMPRIDFTFNE